MNTMRSLFPFFLHNPDLVYLDNAATSQKPNVVIDELTRFYQFDNAPVHRSFYTLAEHTTEKYEAVRIAASVYFGATSKDEIVFTAGATAGLNMLAFGLVLQLIRPGDEIAISLLEHHSAMLPFVEVARRVGAVIRYLPITPLGQVDEAKLSDCITEKTRCVVCTAGSNVVGVENNFLSVLHRAKVVGAVFVLDAAQMAPRRRFNLAELGVDCFVCSVHKMCGPTGLGVLYVAKKWHERCHPWMVGGSMVQQVHCDAWGALPMPTMWEAGTPPIAEVIAFGKALSFLQSIGIDHVMAHEAALSRQFIEGVADQRHISVVGNLDMLAKQGHLASFTVDGWHAHDVAAYLATELIAVRSGYHCAQPLHDALGISQTVRASWYLYTSAEDIARLIDALARLGDG